MKIKCNKIIRNKINIIIKNEKKEKQGNIQDLWDHVLLQI